MKLLITAALVFFQGSALYSQKKEPFKLKDVLSISLKNNISLLETEQSIVVAKQQVREARLLFLPQIYFTGDLARSDVESPAILGNELSYRYIDTSYDNKYLYGFRGTLLQPLYTGGRTTKTLELSKTAFNQEKIKYEAARQEVVYKAKKHFYSALFYKNLLQEARKHYEETRAVFSRMKKGSEYYLEAVRDEMRMKDCLDEAGREYELALISLMETMNLEPEPGFDVEGEFEPVILKDADLNKSVISAMERRPELRSELYQAQIDNIYVNLAMMRKYPNFYLGVSYDVFSDSYSSLKSPALRKENFITYVSIQYPFSYDLWTNVQRKKAKERQSELRRIQMEDEIKFDVMRAYKDYSFYTSKCAEYSVKAGEMGELLRSADSQNGISEIRALKSGYEFRKELLTNVHRQISSLIELEKSQALEITAP